MSNAYYASPLLIMGIVQTAGCIGSGSGTGSLTFSPDGKQVCYLREDRIEEKVVDGKVWSRSISLHWCSVQDPSNESSVHIDTLGAAYRSCVMFLSEAKWSPNSSWIGVLTPVGFTVVEAASGRKVGTHDGILEFAWQSDTQVAYCTYHVTKGMRGQAIICSEDATTRKNKVVYAFPERPAVGLSPAVSWSPSGRFVIVEEPAPGRLHCVDVLDGTIRSFGQTDACRLGVSWTPDSTRAFCVSRRVGPDDLYEAVLFEASTERTADCTSGFRQAFKGRYPSIESQWTSDGKYVLVNHLGGGSLVRPEPWEVIPLGRLIAPRFSELELPKANPWIFLLPVPGWVGVVPTGNYGDSPRQYAVDYSGQSIRPLLEDYPRAISPDGTMAATMGADGQVKIRNLGKWWVSPAIARTTN